jgi:hypothetical protein
MRNYFKTGMMQQMSEPGNMIMMLMMEADSKFRIQSFSIRIQHLPNRQT